MKVGLVGFPGSGKTTVFNSMTGLDAPVGYGGELRLGTVRVPDRRVGQLSALYSPRKTTYAEVTFCDVPGEHGWERSGLSPGSLQRIRDQDVLCLVVGDFGGEGHPETSNDPIAAVTAFHEECLLADLDIASRRSDRLRKERGDAVESAAFEKAVALLEDEVPLRMVPASTLARDPLRGFGLLTDRPLLVVVNVEEARAAEPMADALNKSLVEMGANGISLSASVEADIASMEAEERLVFLDDLGVTEPGIERFIGMAYSALDLISFFTVGPDEVRAWTIRRGTNAKRAAGRIHSDLERGFIRAEVIPWDELLEHGSENAAKRAGDLRIEGRDYVVSDGDVMHVLFNV